MHQGRRLANNSCLGINTQIPAAFWVIAPCYGCITALLPDQSHSAPSATGAFYSEAAPFLRNGGGLTYWKQIRPDGSWSTEGIPCWHLYFAAFGAAAAANVIVVIAIAAMIKRTRSRFWPRWLRPPPLKMALSPL